MKRVNLLSDQAIKLVNYRINQEELSSRIYYGMAVYLDYNGFAGAAKLWYKYAEEELVHAKWYYQFLLDLNIQPTVGALSVQPMDYDGLVDIIEKSNLHEIEITKQINDLLKLAREEDCGTLMELALRTQKEQVEELGKTYYWLDRLEAFGDSEVALRLLDNEMGEKA